MSEKPLLKHLDLEGRVNHFSWLYEEHIGFISQEDREYFWGKGLSNSGLNRFHKSPDHYFHDEFVKTSALVFGSAFHTYILEPQKFDKRFVVAPKFDKRTKQGKEEWREFEASLETNDGSKPKEAITEEDMGSIVNMSKAINAHPLAGNLFKEGIAEETIVWNEEKTGCLMKGKTDWRRPEEKLIIDLKSTRDGNPENLRRSMFSYRYHVQSSIYLDGVTAITGDKDYRFLFVFVEKFPPYPISVVELDSDAIFLGRKSYIEDIEKVTIWLDIARKSLQDGNDVALSHGYSPDVILLDTPKWMIS